ncbi:unnamed protein product, partial [Brassica oleracea]
GFLRRNQAKQDHHSRDFPCCLELWRSKNVRVGPCDIRVTNSLIDAYAKCGCIRSALKFFTEVSNERKNLVSWTTMISAFAMHGMGKEAINLSS